MDDQQVREFRDRWKAVAAIEAEEKRVASMALRWQQMNTILCLAMGLGLPLTEPDAEEEVVRRRWARLKGVQA